MNIATYKEREAAFVERITQLEQEISNLQNEVNEARQAEQDADKERDALTAQYARLDAGVYGLMCDRTSNDRWYELDEIRNTAPVQSLAEIQTSTIETMIDSMDWSKGISPEDCYDYAQQLREGES